MKSFRWIERVNGIGVKIATEEDNKYFYTMWLKIGFTLTLFLIDSLKAAIFCYILASKLHDDVQGARVWETHIGLNRLQKQDVI